MNKIIPFNKEIKFDDMIGEDSYTISGDLIIKGTHKYGDIIEDFSYPIPTTISVDDKYDTSKAKIIVDDFYYEIINDDTLKIKIDLILDELLFKEKEIPPVIEEIKYEEEPIISEDDLLHDNEEKEYSIYRVYMVMEGDTLSKILEKYNITSEELAYYNNLDNIKPGVKLMIPSIDE